MKFLFFTDTHIRGNNPRSRKDIFVETLYLKFQEILDYINNNGIDYVLFGETCLIGLIFHCLLHKDL